MNCLVLCSYDVSLFDCIAVFTAIICLVCCLVVCMKACVMLDCLIVLFVGWLGVYLVFVLFACRVSLMLIC